MKVQCLKLRPAPDEKSVEKSLDTKETNNLNDIDSGKYNTGGFA